MKIISKCQAMTLTGNIMAPSCLASVRVNINGQAVSAIMLAAR